ncbi:uncharacterized protein LOC128200899 [Galleria mellonella]|uniref:Uncharacterized protein LOC128200899 n=1 Tax=Galleria mellonella TaxID=7137 RepID=A0ABM3MK14_GALME|nr:uncharacterized protein LOC128200899 [Galleria mellonella]
MPSPARRPDEKGPYQGHSVPVYSVPSSQGGGPTTAAPPPARARAQRPRSAISPPRGRERSRSRAAHRTIETPSVTRAEPAAPIRGHASATTSRAGLGDADAQRAPQAAPAANRTIAVPHPLAAETAAHSAAAAHTDTDAVPMCRVQQRTTARPGSAADVPMSPASPPDTDTTTTAPRKGAGDLPATGRPLPPSGAAGPSVISGGVRASVCHRDQH